ncbi:MAG: YraN family protein [bacterium]
MPGNNASLGKKGEQLALDHLIALGYTIEARNYRCPFGEVDIIARDKEILVFIEVKTRVSGRFGSPQEAVDLRKQQRLSRIALHYLACTHTRENQETCRFDVVSVIQTHGEEWSINVIKDAFSLL